MVQWNSDSIALPKLPLISQWASSAETADWNPDAQITLLDAGNPMMICFAMPDVNWDSPDDAIDSQANFEAYYEDAIKAAASANAPICFSGTQFERLVQEEPYASLPAAVNPNVVELTTENILTNQGMDPWGPLEYAREIGHRVIGASKQWWGQLWEWYPSPPLVLMLSNNEHFRLTFNNVETVSDRYVNLYGTEQSDDDKHRVLGNGIAQHKAAVLGAMKSEFPLAWQRAMRIVGYQGMTRGLDAYGRSNEWQNFSDTTADRLDPHVYAFDGTSIEYYTPIGDARTDWKLRSPQVECMNYKFVRENQDSIKKNLWFDMSFWDGRVQAGDETDSQPDQYIITEGQTYPVDRYVGWALFGMWCLRPHAYRQFRFKADVYATDDAGNIWEAMVAAIKFIHDTATLAEFWQHGTILPHQTDSHPYSNALLSTEYPGWEADRWFLLDVDVNNDPLTVAGNQAIAVYSLALEMGTTGNKEWLVYAHSPLQAYTDAVITVPGYDDITVDVARDGSYYHVLESDDSVTEIT